MQVRRQSEFARHKGYEIASITDVPQNILEKIVWQKEREVAQMYANESLDAVKAKLVNVQPARDFYGRLQNSLT
ncbi:MAG: indole-3-glycerol-phosphate synthase TrpC, partial [Pseudanabaena sp.]